MANTFNSRLEPTELKATSPLPLTLLDLAYSYDQGGGKNNGSVAQIANLRDSTRTANYTYDLLNRLSSAATTAATWGDSYGYDNWGNLLAKTVTKGSGENLLPLTIDSHNQIKNAGFAYDAAGNMLSDGSNSMIYDAENRRNPTSGTTFTYDGDGRRVAKSDGTVYWVDDNFRPLSLGTNTGSITKDFVFLGSKRIAFVALSSGNPYYYLSDHLGSTAVIGSGDGKAIEWEADYFPFGNQRQVFTNLVSNLYQFTGYEYDSSSGYNYAVARFEAGKWSRFLSPDPYLGSMDITNPQSLNRYTYVVNDPVNMLDPSGLSGFDPKSLNCMFDESGNCVAQGGGGGTAFGNDIFDAIAGAPGTYFGFDMYGNMQWGFSVDKWQSDMWNADREAAEAAAARDGDQSASAKADITIQVNCYSSFGVGWDCWADPNDIGLFQYPFHSVHVGDVAAGALAQGIFQGNRGLWQQSSKTVNVLAGTTAVLAGGIPAFEAAAVAIPGSVDSANGGVFWLEAHGVPATIALAWAQQQLSRGVQPTIFQALSFWLRPRH